MKKYLYCFCFFIIAISVVLFSNFNSTNNVTYAEKQGNNPLEQEIILESENGRYSFFDSLYSSAIVSEKITYYDNGIKTTSSKVIKRTTTDYLAASKISSGNGSIRLSNDIKSLCKINGINVYVKASVGLLALSNDSRDKVDFYISAGDKTETIYSNAISTTESYMPEFVETEKIQINNIEDLNDIHFGFKSKGGYGEDNSKGFMIFNPKLIFVVEIDSINLNTGSTNVFNGEKISLSAHNPITNLLGNEQIEYLKKFFAIEWEIVENSSLAILDKNFLTINSNTETIKVRAKSKSITESNNYIYSSAINFTIENEEKVGVISNFEQAILNVTQTKIGDKFQVIINIDKGYAYHSSNISSQNVVVFTDENGFSEIRFNNIQNNENIDLKLKKELKVNINIEDKIFDGEVNARILSITTNKNFNHDAKINGLSAVFADYNAGEKDVLISGVATITGNDSQFYYLSEEMFNQDGTFKNSNNVIATIYPKEVLVKANPCSKEYSEEDPILTYIATGLVGEEDLLGELSRESGEAVWNYRILKGTLGDENNNYKIIFHSNIFTISKKVIKLSQDNNTIEILDKIYDKSSSITTGEEETEVNEDGSLTYKNGYLKIHYRVVDGDNKISIEAKAFYDSSDAGSEKNGTLSLQLKGATSQYYQLEYNGTIKGNILKKDITITADNIEKEFGDLDPKLTYTITEGNLISGDHLQGSLVRDSSSNYIGEYIISQGSLNNSNYNIKFIEGTLKISPRKISIEAIPSSKVYLNKDPSFEYRIEEGELVAGYPLDLVLTRDVGELIGDYYINIFSNNEVYEIVNYSPAIFSITQRKIEIVIEVLEKEYEASDNAQIKVTYKNIPTYQGVYNPDEIILKENITAKFEETIIGTWPVKYYYNNEEVVEFSSVHVESNNKNCYSFQFTQQAESEIKKRSIKIKLLAAMRKSYGELDPDFNNYEIINEFPGIESYLFGEITREEGEEVGNYNVLLGTLTDNNNPNFNISFYENYIFNIVKRQIIIKTEFNNKIYGENDPKINFYLSEETPLPYNVFLANILNPDCAPTREVGENVGAYKHLIGTIDLLEKEKSRYELEFQGSELTINPRVLTIQIDDKIKEYGEIDPKFEFKIINGSLANQSDIKIVRELGENVGSYNIYSDIDKNNYTFNEIKGVLTIHKANITVIPKNYTKTYGDEDPKFFVKIFEGNLKFNDELEDILTGELSREVGEDVGSYQINRGTLSANSNYELIYIGSAVLKIIPKQIEVVPNQINLFLDEYETLLNQSTFKLRYTVFGLCYDDVLNGELNVIIPENTTGKFLILQGSLTNENNPNYVINFAEEYVNIYKRKLNIRGNKFVITYNASAIFNPTQEVFSIYGDIKKGHTAEYFGISYRCYPEKDVGEYPIIITYNNTEEINKYYDIEVENGTFKIEKANLEITAIGQELVYGEVIPKNNELKYQISGIIYDDEFSFSLYWEENKNVGTYNIFIKCENSNNYNIVFNSSAIDIRKKIVTLQISNLEKTYGDPDPNYIYSFKEDNAILEGDIIDGEILREEGEDIGTYLLMSKFSNPNYEIIQEGESYLKINKRDLLVEIFAKDKVYDGTKDVELQILKFNIAFEDILNLIINAEFENENVGNNKAVIVNNYELVGEKALNYNVVFKNFPTANIAHKFLTDGDVTIYVENDNPILTEDVVLVVTKLDIDQLKDFNSLNAIAGYNIKLLKNGNELEINKELNVEIKLININNYQEINNLELIYSNNNIQQDIKCVVSKDKISFTTKNMGDYIIVEKENSKTIIYIIAGLGISSVLAGTVIGVIFYFKKKR